MWDKPFLIFGHRGSAGTHPENTLSSFKEAMRAGANGIELDLRMSKDNHLVVIHDATLTRTTDQDGFVSDKTLDELRKCDAGDGQGIPTLEDVLRLVETASVLVNIELKNSEISKALVDTLRNRRKEFIERVLVSSFNHKELLKFHALMPEVKIGMLLASHPLINAKYPEELTIWSLHLNNNCVDQEIVDDAHKRALKVYVYTVNEHRDLKRMKDLGVDGVFSDYPEAAISS